MIFLLILGMFLCMTAISIWVEGFCTTSQAKIMCRVIFALIMLFACYDIYSYQGVYWKW